MILLDYICEGVDLSGVEIIEQDRRFIKQARKDVETQAHKMLEQGMETQVPYILAYKYVSPISRKYFLRQILGNLLMSRL